MAFKDHFSRAPADYRRFRPGYPRALFEFLAGLAPARELAWDAATGNGQAATGVAEYFPLVVATDASAGQLAQRQRDPRIVYACARAERTPLRARSCDLITVAQAAHWLDLRDFYAEAGRVARPGAVLALWTYSRCHVDPHTDGIVAQFNREVIGSSWPAERRYVDDGYRSLPFPFPALDGPAFELVTEWSLAQFTSYVRTWSAVGRFSDATGRDPVPELASQLAVFWPADMQRRIRWPLHLRVGRVRGG